MATTLTTTVANTAILSSVHFATSAIVDAAADAMASKRPPLASVPNAVNSPYRQHGSNNTTIGKRPRPHDSVRDAACDQQPPAKKQLLDHHHRRHNEENIRPDATRIRAEEQQFLKRPANAQPTALERKLAAVASLSRQEKRQISVAAESRLQQQQQQQQQQMRGTETELESIRQWQRHYRRQFPSFVFYFDNTPDNVRQKIVRQLQSLGAREEKFFSNSVTHVVTTRTIPAEMAEQQQQQQALQVIAPAALLNNDARKAASSLLENTLQQRRVDGDIRRTASHAADILTRARELNIKIWALEKLERILRVMFENVNEQQGTVATTRQPTAASTNTAITITATQATKSAKNADLEQLLRNERINGPADRDKTVATQDMCHFKGCYIYIHDMDEKTKPVMVRDYPRPSTKDLGKWPQFRISSLGRCPFIEDPSQAQQQQELEQKQAKAQRDRLRTRRADERDAQPLAESHPNARRSPRKLTANAAVEQKADLAKPLDPPKLVPVKRIISNEEMPAVFGSAQMNVRGLPRMIGGIPIASGMQHSNVTSAIRSQAISSAAISSTAPGITRRVPDSKEVSVLKRKVLERTTTAITSQPPSSYMNDMRAAINDESAAPPPRAAKRKAQESILGVVNEDDENISKPTKRSVKRSKVERDPKAGYCENCKDKFDDFEEHIHSRKHQRFARAAENFKELDELLSKLRRPHRAQ